MRSMHTIETAQRALGALLRAGLSKEEIARRLHIDPRVLRHIAAGTKGQSLTPRLEQLLAEAQGTGERTIHEVADVIDLDGRRVTVLREDGKDFTGVAVVAEPHYLGVFVLMDGGRGRPPVFSYDEVEKVYVHGAAS